MALLTQALPALLTRSESGVATRAGWMFVGRAGRTNGGDLWRDDAISYARHRRDAPSDPAVDSETALERSSSARDHGPQDELPGAGAAGNASDDEDATGKVEEGGGGGGG